MSISSRNTLTNITRIMFDQMSGHTMAQSRWHIKLTIMDGNRKMSLLLYAWDLQVAQFISFLLPLHSSYSPLLLCLALFSILFFILLYLPCLLALLSSMVLSIFYFPMKTKVFFGLKKDDYRLFSKDCHHFDLVTEMRTLTFHSRDIMRIFLPVSNDMIKISIRKTEIYNNIKTYLILQIYLLEGENSGKFVGGDHILEYLDPELMNTGSRHQMPFEDLSEEWSISWVVSRPTLNKQEDIECCM